MKNRLKKISLILIGAAVIVMLTGCENERTKNQEAYRQYGINCIENGQYEDAIDAFQKALDQSIGSVGDEELDICFYKAEAQFLNNDYDGAMETYNALINYNKNPDAYFLRGKLYFAMGQNEDALKDFETAVKLDKNNYELYIGIYESMATHEMASDGEYYLNQGLAIEGDKAENNMQKGRIYFILGDIANASSYLQKALDQDSVDANYYMAQVCESNGDSDAADSYIQTYLEKAKVDSVDLCTLGDQEMDSQDYGQAVIYYQMGLELDKVPNKQALMRKCIAAYEYSGDFASAKELMNDYLEEYPSDEDAQRESVFLETR